MAGLPEILAELERVIADHERNGRGLTDLPLKKLGFENRELTASDKQELSAHEFDYVACWTKKEGNFLIDILERDRDTSRAFDVRPDRATVLVKVKSEYQWLENA
jgi:hypothetical protein